MKLGALVVTCMCLAASANVFAEQLVTKSYPVKNVREIVVEGPAEIDVRQGEAASLAVEAAAEVMDKITIDASGDRVTLRVKNQKNGLFSWFSEDLGEVKFVIEIADLAVLKLAGAAHANMADLQTTALDIDLGGASRAAFGHVQLESLDLKLSGASHVVFDTLQGQTANMSGSGASHIKVTGESTLSDLAVDLSGASHYTGTNLMGNNVQVKVSGASHAKVMASDTLDASASGASSISYAGNPRVKQHVSGASSVRSLDN